MKIKILLILILIPNFLPAQIQNKLEYIYTKPSLTGAAILSAVFFKDFDIRSSIKIRGIDDSLEADNDIELELNNQEITFFDVTGMQIRDSLHTRFFGTFHVRNYDLTPEEKNKKMFNKKGPDGTYQWISVKRDSSGRAYFNDWTNSGSVTITNSQIKHILVVNRNIWVNSQKEKKK